MDHCLAAIPASGFIRCPDKPDGHHCINPPDHEADNPEHHCTCGARFTFGDFAGITVGGGEPTINLTRKQWEKTINNLAETIVEYDDMRQERDNAQDALSRCASQRDWLLNEASADTRHRFAELYQHLYGRRIRTTDAGNESD